MYSVEYVGFTEDYVNDEKRDVYKIYKDNELIYVDEKEASYMYLMFEIDEESKTIVFTKRPISFDDCKIYSTHSYYDNRLHPRIKENNESLYSYLKETLPLLIGFEIVNL